MATAKNIAKEFMENCTAAGKNVLPTFDYNDLNEVMIVVDEFCDNSHPVCLQCKAPNNYMSDKRFRVMPGFGNRTIYGSKQPKYYADIIQMYPGEDGHQQVIGSAKSDNLCTALLEACVNTAKNLKK